MALSNKIEKSLLMTQNTNNQEYQILMQLVQPPECHYYKVSTNNLFARMFGVGNLVSQI
jgi:hypothetical protein